jgi:cold shock CspA family protein
MSSSRSIPPCFSHTFHPGLPASLFALALAVIACGHSGPRSDGAQGRAPTPIASARAKPSGTVVTVEGHVSVPPGAFASALSDEGFAVQDDTGGIYVKVAEKQPFGLGAHVHITGTLDEQNQLRILKAMPADISTLSGTKQVTAKDVATGAVNESVEGQLIHTSGAVTQTFKDDSPYGYKLYINDGSGEAQVFVHVSAGLDKAMLQALTSGQRITVRCNLRGRAAPTIRPDRAVSTRRRGFAPKPLAATPAPAYDGRDDRSRRRQLRREADQLGMARRSRFLNALPSCHESTDHKIIPVT